MAITIELSPERESALRAQAEAHGLTLERWLVRLADQHAEEALGANETESRPIWEVIADSMKDVPAEDLESLPRDGASQLDHYLYGHPKRD